MASVKPNKMLDSQRGGLAQPGRFVRTATTLRGLVGSAHCRVFQHCEIVGGPTWIDSDRFDIEARGDFTLADYLPRPDGSPGRVYLMLQSLLAERFSLALHPEMREEQIYTLVMANREGKLGPHLRRSDFDCDAFHDAWVKSGKLLPPPREPGQGPPCSVGTPPGKLIIEDLTMSHIANILSGRVGRAVKDQTGLTGSFDLTLEWSPDQLGDASGLSIFTALQEQLGLKLEPSRGPVEVLVVDRAERPGPD